MELTNQCHLSRNLKAKASCWTPCIWLSLQNTNLCYFCHKIIVCIRTTTLQLFFFLLVKFLIKTGAFGDNRKLTFSQSTRLLQVWFQAIIAFPARISQTIVTKLTSGTTFLPLGHFITDVRFVSFSNNFDRIDLFGKATLADNIFIFDRSIFFLFRIQSWDVLTVRLVLGWPDFIHMFFFDFYRAQNKFYFFQII